MLEFVRFCACFSGSSSRLDDISIRSWSWVGVLVWFCLRFKECVFVRKCVFFAYNSTPLTIYTLSYWYVWFTIQALRQIKSSVRTTEYTLFTLSLSLFYLIRFIHYTCAATDDVESVSCNIHRTITHFLLSLLLVRLIRFTGAAADDVESGSFEQAIYPGTDPQPQPTLLLGKYP
jgi:hypothetical protein